MSEGVFWAFSILEENDYELSHIDESLLEELASFVNENKENFEMDRSSFGRELQRRYRTVADFFLKKKNKIYPISDYLDTTAEFKKSNREIPEAEDGPEENQF